MNTVNHALVLRITELLKKNKITRYKLAMDSGVSHSTLKNIMHETVKDNLLSTTILIANGFGMSVSEFLNSPLFVYLRTEFPRSAILAMDFSSMRVIFE